MTFRHRLVAPAYAVACLAVLVATAVRIALNPLLGNHFPSEDLDP